MILSKTLGKLATINLPLGLSVTSSSKIMTDSRLTSIEACKQRAACSAVESNILADTNVVGIGSGSTIYYVVKQIANLNKDRQTPIRCIPTSIQSKKLIDQFGLHLGDLDRDPVIDVTIDGADEVDANLVAIKGGGACLAQEKVVASASKRFAVVADHSKDSEFLGQKWKQGIPIEVLPMASNLVRHKLAAIFDIDMPDLVIRNGTKKAGPVITDNGNIIIDWQFSCGKTSKYTRIDWQKLADGIKLIPGVVETGLFVGMIDEVHFGRQDGQVDVRGRTQ